MFKDTKANKIFMISVLAILFILIIRNKSSDNEKTNFNEIEISNSITIESLSDINIWVDDSIDNARVVYSTKGNGKIEVKSSNGNTIIEEKLKKKFFLSIDFEDDSSNISLYLPSSKINNLKIDTIAGDVNTYNKIQANDIDIKSISGDIDILDIDADKIILTSVSGDITTGVINGSNSFKAKTTSGDVSVDAIIAKNSTMSSSSGSIEALKVSIDDTFNASSISGDIEVQLVTSKSLNTKTTSGSIEINDKDINSNSYSNENSIGNGKGEYFFKTISGDIEIDY